MSQATRKNRPSTSARAAGHGDQGGHFAAGPFAGGRAEIVRRPAKGDGSRCGAGGKGSGRAAPDGASCSKEAGATSRGPGRGRRGHASGRGWLDGAGAVPAPPANPLPQRPREGSHPRDRGKTGGQQDQPCQGCDRRHPSLPCGFSSRRPPDGIRYRCGIVRPAYSFRTASCDSCPLGGRSSSWWCRRPACTSRAGGTPVPRIVRSPRSSRLFTRRAGAGDQLGHADAEVVVEHEHFAAGDQPAVDEDVDRVARQFVQRHDGAFLS